MKKSGLEKLINVKGSNLGKLFVVATFDCRRFHLCNDTSDPCGVMFLS
jgi:hypothetical protein